MNKQSFTILFFLLISIFSFATNTNVYKYDYDDPESIVRSAFLMLKNADFRAMLDITDLYEKKRVLSIITEVSSNTYSESIFIAESKKMKSFEIIGKEEYTNDSTNNFAIIITRWIILNDSKTPKNSDIYDGVEAKINPKPKSRVKPKARRPQRANLKAK